MSKELSILVCLALAQFTNIVDFMIIMPLGPQLMDMFKISTTQFSILVSVYSIASGVSALLSSFYIDDFDRKRSFLVIYAGFLVGTLCCALSPTYEILLLARLFTGFFGGIIGSQVYSIVGDLIPFERRGRATGIVMNSFSLASVLGVPLSIYVASKFSWHAPFIGLVLLGSCLWVLCRSILPKMDKHLVRETKRKKTEIYTYLFKNKHLFVTLFLFPVLMFAHFIVIPFISPYMFLNVGFSNSELSYIYLVGGACTIFSSPFVGKMVDRFGAKNVFYVFALLALAPMYILVNLPAVPIWQALIVTALFFMIGSARMIPALSAINSSVPSQYRGGFLSLNTAFHSVGTGLASYVAGIIVTVGPDKKLQNYDQTFYIVLVATAVCFYIFSQLKVYRER